ncbi:hypothetical protein pEaSNUABM47_00499 [Erwinia phage pEa_SNUABM_47]|uniref:Uncharacterized protein n=1 Tax=Erwinia phage pEa_SNUABM_47 TaxID=2768774 RepID=A0A7L8ZNB5_9CAUD|nr:hypothetical protein pEaSNUABM47_00499 [Erwinia phage pEa_SNUABM_47]QXO12170.1 hypothetical protein pEaSNUABM44_00503 [Erwinia phage pEa_SNUABM_44]QXO12726.1 hypothetical protein pEaSNUABM49_00507 [Erwinia phage pEa_SNUABM_49]
MILSTGEAALALLVWQSFLTLLAYMQYLVDSSKKDYREYLALVERTKGKFRKQLYTIYDCIDNILGFWIVGCLPSIGFLIYIFK